MRGGDTCSEMSQTTVDSAEIVRRGTSSSNLDYAPFEVRPAWEWTNEKHCLYLKSMEASFVNELHCSMGLLRGQARKMQLLENDSFQQHKSCRDGFWKNINANEFGSKSEMNLETRVLMTNPWIRHFRRTGKHQAVEAAVSRDIDLNAEQDIEFEKRANLVSDIISRPSRTTLSHEDSVGSNTEMSDQNFVDHDDSNKSCSLRRAKRKKTEANNNTESDQVVPKDMTTTSDCKRMTPSQRC